MTETTKVYRVTIVFKGGEPMSCLNLAEHLDDTLDDIEVWAGPAP